MTARVIPVAFGDDATPVSAGECGCTPLDGCCLPPRPRLVTTTEEQQDDPAPSVSTNTSEVEFPAFRLKGAEEMVWFKAYLRDNREWDPEGDFFLAIEGAVRSVEERREEIAALLEVRADIQAAIEDQAWDYAEELIEEFFPEDDYPAIVDLATADAPRFIELLVEQLRTTPIATIEELYVDALDLVERHEEVVAAAEIAAEIDTCAKICGEETALSIARDIYSRTVPGYDFSDFSLDEFKMFAADVADYEEAGVNPAVAVEYAFNDVVRERNEPEEQDEVCDCIEGACALDDDESEDLTHLDRIIYVYPAGNFIIEEPLYRVVLDDGTHCIESDEAGFEMPPGFVGVVLYPAALRSALNHIEF